MAEARVNDATREAWLNQAALLVTPLFTEVGAKLPDKLQLSVGFPGGGNRRTRIGECWPSKSSAGVVQVFVSPVLGTADKVLATLVHELVHAADDCAHGHRGPFARIARQVGLAGKLTATTAGPELAERLVTVAGELGPYPHQALTLTDGARKVQTTRMLKLTCPTCGYTARTTAKWIEVGLPTCPCGEEMETS